MAGIVRSVPIEIAEGPHRLGRPDTRHDITVEGGGKYNEAVTEGDAGTSGSHAEMADGEEGFAQVITRFNATLTIVTRTKRTRAAGTASARHVDLHVSGGANSLPENQPGFSDWLTSRAPTHGQGRAGWGPCHRPPIPTPPNTPREGSIGEAVRLQGWAQATLPAQPLTAAADDGRVPTHHVLHIESTGPVIIPEFSVPVVAARVPNVTRALPSRRPAILIRSFLAIPTARGLASGCEW